MLYSSLRDDRARRLVRPVRVIQTYGHIQNADALLSDVPDEAYLGAFSGCVLEKGGAALLDFGEELHGTVRITVNLIGGGVKTGEMRVRTGESVTEALADDGYKNDVLSVVYLEGFQKGVATDSGDRLPVLLCYAINGYPNVDDENHAGYTGLAGNTAGPLRAIVEGTQGASVKYCVKLVVTVPGSDPIDITVDPAVFQEG